MSWHDSAVLPEVVAKTAAAHAHDVDAEARFPHETIDALRAEGLLATLVPAEFGGPGTGFGTDLEHAAAVVRSLARHCASSAMILAMHHIQVACLVRHAGNEALTGYLRRVAEEQLLLASATTELGIGGNTRRSSCYVEAEAGRFNLAKQAPVISYGEYADAILTTARRTEFSTENDQVLVVCEKPETTLTPMSEWNTLGFRGTCSRGFSLESGGPLEMVCDVPFGDISAATMLPVSHLLWAALWVGVADEATDRARRFVQKSARRDLASGGALSPAATRLAELMVTRQRLAASVESLLRRYVGCYDDLAATASVDFMIEINTLKVSGSQLLTEIVGQALLICGIAGYREDSEFSLGRLLRDSHGAAVMVNNDRIIANTAQLSLAKRGN